MSMRKSDKVIIAVGVFVLMAHGASASAAEHARIKLSLDELDVVNRDVVVTSNAVNLSAAPGAGLAWVQGLEVNEGCLALEVKGSNEEGRSFVGLAFRGVDNDTYDTVYLRPFVYQSDDPARSSNALQYMSLPDFGWPVLRERSPGVYEKSLGSRPSPDAWVQLVVKFGEGRLRVFADGAKQPQLDVPLLTQQAAGRVALWVGNNSAGSFRNLRRCD
jgi:hypothetical protein